MVRSITNAGRRQEASQATSHSLSDAELLRRLEGLQEDLRWLEGQLKARMPKDLRRKRNRQWRDHAAQNQTALPSQELGEGEASDYRSNPGQGT
jgi:hypothetical protein